MDKPAQWILKGVCAGRDIFRNTLPTCTLVKLVRATDMHDIIDSKLNLIDNI